MKLTVQNQELTPKDFTRYIACKVIEDLDTHFDEYAAAAWKDYANLSDVEKAKVNEWKHKEIIKLYKFLNKDGFNEESSRA